MKKIILILLISASVAFAGVWTVKTVYSSTTLTSTTTDTSAVFSLKDLTYLERYYSGTGYVKTTVQGQIAGTWVSLITNDSCGSQYKTLVLNNLDTMRIKVNNVRFINAITVSSGTSTFKATVNTK